jgi:hypothetical protein
MIEAKVICHPLILAVLAWSATLGTQQKPTPSQPSVVAAPIFSRAVEMPDGRIFVTDGGMAIDATVAKPATMPTTVLSGKLLDGYIKAQGPDEMGLDGLRVGNSKNTFLGPHDIPVNGNYVAFLRRVAPRCRLRFKGPRDPIVVVLNGTAIGVLMPVAS